MAAAPECPRPVLQQDARALIGVLAILEGAAMTEQLDRGFLDHLSRRFASECLLTDDASERQLRQAINDLNHRLRYALGEYDQQPEPMPVP